MKLEIIKMNGDNKTPPATDLMIKFIQAITRLQDSVQKLTNEVNENNRQLKQNNIVSKDLYTMMDAHYQNLEEFIKKGAGVQMLLGIAKTFIPRR